MPWSIFKDGGGQGSARTWGQDLLSGIGAPLTTGNEQFIYDWEVSEGGGGKFNPLNQGPVPGHPELTSTGEQFGGGAADYVSWQAGLQGAQDYLAFSNFSDIKADLKADQPETARAALISSNWATNHYDDGNAFSDAPLPGKATALPKVGSGGISTTSITNPLDPSSWFNSIATAFGAQSVADLAERAGLILLGGALIIVGIVLLGGGKAAESIVLPELGIAKGLVKG